MSSLEQHDDMSILDRYTASLDVLERAIRTADAERWDDPSPCAEWNAREVAGHAMTFIRNVVALAGDGPDPDFRAEVDLAGAAGPAPGRTWTATRALVEAELLDRPDRLARTVMTPLGAEMPVEDFLAFQGMDPVVHGWDIATATGGEVAIPPALAAGYQARFEPFSEVIRERGLLAERLPAGGDPVAQLLAFCGRTPR